VRIALISDKQVDKSARNVSSLDVTDLEAAVTLVFAGAHVQPESDPHSTLETKDPHVF
jgi:hypothetical protein